MLGLAAQYEVGSAKVIGRVTRGEFRIELNGATVIRADVPSLADDWTGAIERAPSRDRSPKGRMNR